MATQASKLAYEQVLPLGSNSTPYNFKLNHAFKVDSELTLVGTPHGQRFSIDMMSAMSNCPGTKSTDIALHLSVRFDENTIVRNSMYKGAWISEKRDGGMPLKPNQVFSLKIQAKHDGYNVYVNEFLFTDYKHPLYPKFVTDVALYGDITLNNVIYLTKLVFSSPCNHVPCNIPMKSGFLPGTQLDILGIAQGTKDCFAIDLETHTRHLTNIALHLKPVFKGNYIVRNSLINKVWGSEERDTPMSVRPGNQYLISIRCEAEGYKIYLNKSLFTFFKHRLPPHGVDNISISGGVLVNKVTYNPTQVSNQ